MMGLLQKKKVSDRAEGRKLPRKSVPAPLALPPGTVLPLPSAITSALRGVSSRQLLVNWMECVVLVLAALPSLFLAQALADWLFNLPWVVRFFLLLFDISAVVYLLRRFAWLPWKRKLTIETAALRVEREIPEFRSGLISAVELSSGKAGSGQGSLDLVKELISHVAIRIRSANVSKRVVKTVYLKRWSKWMAGAILLSGAAAFFFWPKTPVLLQRILLSNVALPTKTVVIPITRDGSISLGSDMVLSAKAEGFVPKSGRMQVIYSDKERQDISVSGTVDDPAVFSVSLKNVQQSFRYRFILNDGTGPEFIVSAKTPPVLASFRCVQKYPGYTGLGEAEMAAGNLSLLAGSRVRIEGQSTQELKSAVIRLEGANLEVELKTSGKSISGEFAVPKQGLTGFSIALVNQEGVASLENTTYRVEFIDDKPPVVELVFPAGERLSVLSRTKPQLVYSVKDDFGLKKIALKYELSRPASPGKEEAPAEAGEVALPVPASASSGEPQTYVWDLSAAKPAWPEGSTVRYWIEARDNNDVTGPGIGESMRKSLAILSEEAKKAELLEKLGNIANDLENVYNTQKKVNETLDSTIRKNQP